MIGDVENGSRVQLVAGKLTVSAGMNVSGDELELAFVGSRIPDRIVDLTIDERPAKLLAQRRSPIVPTMMLIRARFT